MDENRLSQLTDRQKQCLRLAARPMTSKEIALELDLSYRTVENHLANAVQTLGADSRFAAARMLVGSEKPPEYKLPEYPQSLVSQSHTPLMGASGNDGGREASGDQMGVLREVQAPFEMSFQRPAASRWSFSIPMTDGEYHDLNIQQRLILIGAIGIVSLLAFGAIPAGFLALKHLL